MPSNTLPDTLPVAVYLLAWDPGRQRFPSGQQLGYVVSGAALADLSLRGCVFDDGGKVKPSASKRTGDPLLDDVLRAMSESRPRSWRTWVNLRARPTLVTVQNQLAAAGIARVECRRALGIFRYRRVTLTDTEPATAVRAMVRGLVTGGGPVSDRDAALVALVAAGDLRSALSRRERKEYAAQVTACTERSGPAAPALRKVLRGVKAARATAQAGGGG